jgi:hypothetical protein
MKGMHGEEGRFGGVVERSRYSWRGEFLPG